MRTAHALFGALAIAASAGTAILFSGPAAVDGEKGTSALIAGLAAVVRAAHAGHDGYAGLDARALAEAGAMPLALDAAARSGTGPWGGRLRLSSDADGFAVGLTDAPGRACSALLSERALAALGPGLVSVSVASVGAKPVAEGACAPRGNAIVYRFR